MYIGPPDIIITNAGKNFTSNEFKNSAKALSIDVKEVPVEAHNSIGKVKRYYASLRRAYTIIRTELPQSSPELCLSLTVKVINDIAGPNGLILTLLVFGAYLRISTVLIPSSGVIERAAAVRKAMKKLAELRTKRQIRDALSTRNGPDTTQTLQLSSNDDVLVWREFYD